MTEARPPRGTARLLVTLVLVAAVAALVTVSVVAGVRYTDSSLWHARALAAEPAGLALEVEPDGSYGWKARSRAATVLMERGVEAFPALVEVLSETGRDAPGRAVILALAGYLLDEVLELDPRRWRELAHRASESARSSDPSVAAVAGDVLFTAVLLLDDVPDDELATWMTPEAAPILIEALRDRRDGTSITSPIECLDELLVADPGYERLIAAVASEPSAWRELLSDAPDQLAWVADRPRIARLLGALLDTTTDGHDEHRAASALVMIGEPGGDGLISEADADAGRPGVLEPSVRAWWESRRDRPSLGLASAGWIVVDLSPELGWSVVEGSRRRDVRARLLGAVGSSERWLFGPVAIGRVTVVARTADDDELSVEVEVRGEETVHVRTEASSEAPGYRWVVVSKDVAASEVLVRDR